MRLRKIFELIKQKQDIEQLSIYIDDYRSRKLEELRVKFFTDARDLI